MMKKLLKITEISMLPKSPNYQRYRFQILISQIEDWNEDCVDRNFIRPSPKEGHADPHFSEVVQIS